MRKVNIVGHIKTPDRHEPFDETGYMQGNVFYPDRNNARIFYKVVTCHRNWDVGILAQFIEDLEHD